MKTKLLITILAFLMLGCSTETLIEDTSSERNQRRNEIIYASTQTDGTVEEYLQGLELVSTPRGNIRNWTHIIFPNDVTGNMYFNAYMRDANYQLDFCRAQYPTNGINGYALGCPLEYDTTYYLVLRRAGMEDVTIEIFIPR